MGLNVDGYNETQIKWLIKHYESEKKLKEKIREKAKKRQEKRENPNWIRRIISKSKFLNLIFYGTMY